MTSTLPLLPDPHLRLLLRACGLLGFTRTCRFTTIPAAVYNTAFCLPLYTLPRWRLAEPPLCGSHIRFNITRTYHFAYLYVNGFHGWVLVLRITPLVPCRDVTRLPILTRVRFAVRRVRICASYWFGFWITCTQLYHTCPITDYAPHCGYALMP